jgi:DNA-binding transcriptional LysR family regulator
MPDEKHGYLRHLANFAYVVEAGSISAAANRLGASASALSESVKLLETHLGEPLLERRRSGVVPTGRGLTLLPEAQEIVAALGRALGPKDDATSATLRLSLPSELAEGWFDTALARIQQDLPEITLVLMIEDALVDHTKYARDLHVRAGKAEARAGLTPLATGEARAVMVAQTQLLQGIDPSAPKAIAQLPFLARPRAGRMAEIGLSDGTKLRFPSSLQISAITTRIACMRAGLGVTTCLDRSVRQGLDTGALTRLLPDLFDHPVSIAIASPHKRPPAAARKVAEILGAALALAPPQG